MFIQHKLLHNFVNIQNKIRIDYIYLKEISKTYIKHFLCTLLKGEISKEIGN